MFRFPWGDMHSLNLGWFLQKFNELREDWATAEAGIDGALDAEIQKAEDALSDVFDARDAAAASATAAAGSASAAGTSATAAQNSATGAASSATLANQKATAAGLSEAAAAQSATQASNSATAAAGSATQAGQSATNAAASETAAGQSASAAAGSATAAGNSATAAAASETAAAASAAAAAASAASAASIEDPINPNSYYGVDFTIVKNGVTITKTGNKINFNGHQTGVLSLRPFSDDYISAGQYVKPPFLSMLNGSDASFNPSYLVLETSIVNHRETDGATMAYIYSQLYKPDGNNEVKIIQQHLRANNIIPAGLASAIITRTEITADIINGGIAYDIFFNSGNSEVDLDIIFKIRACNSSYML